MLCGGKKSEGSSYIWHAGRGSWRPSEHGWTLRESSVSPNTSYQEAAAVDLVSGADTTFHSSFLFGSHPLLLLLRSVIVPIPPLAILSLQRTECVLDFLESLNEKKGNSERWLESIFLFFIQFVLFS